jgi:hypothetical protein
MNAITQNLMRHMTLDAVADKVKGKAIPVTGHGGP